MKVLDPGHVFALAQYDGDGEQRLTFMKREGAGYPGNAGHFAGTNCQEVLRALIARVSYLQEQIPCEENRIILSDLRDALLRFESRAAQRHGHTLAPQAGPIETWATCGTCGHVGCRNHASETAGIRSVALEAVIQKWEALAARHKETAPAYARGIAECVADIRALDASGETT